MADATKHTCEHYNHTEIYLTMSLICCLVVLKDICNHELLKQLVPTNEPIPETWIDLDHDPTASTVVSTTVVDKNYIPLVTHLPRFLPEKSHVRCLT